MWTIPSFPYEEVWELWTEHQTRRFHGFPWQREAWEGLTKTALMKEAALGGKARKPLLKAAKPQVTALL